MKLSDIKDLILFCKSNGVEYVEFGDFKASIPREVRQSTNTVGEESNKLKPAGLWDHLDGEEPDFTPPPKKEDS